MLYDDISKIFEGFDHTSSPASNAGDPLARKKPINTLSVHEEIDNLLFDKKEVDQPKKEIKNKFDISEEELKNIDNCLEYFKEDNSIDELKDIISKLS